MYSLMYCSESKMSDQVQKFPEIHCILYGLYETLQDMNQGTCQ